MNPTVEYAGIYWVVFTPSVGHEYQGKRPAVVIQANASLKKGNLATIMPLTSQITKSHSTDILVKKSVLNKLYGDSLVKVQSIESFDRSRFKKRIGTMENDVMVKVQTYLKEHFDI
jgi:mRNA interferase MazF